MKPMTIEELCNALDEFPDEANVHFENYDLVGWPHSWRGSYRELAIDYPGSMEIKAKFFSRVLRACIGCKFTGWKGGEYEMTKDTLVWKSQHGSYSKLGIVGVTSTNYEQLPDGIVDDAILVVAECDY